MYAWTGSWNYIRHPGVALATSLRVVTNKNSFNNDSSELPKDDVLFGDPDALYPLQRSLACWRIRKHEVMTGLART